MEIQFLGAAKTVTGSMHLVSANGKSILLDCGLFQGRRDEAYRRNKTFPFDASTIDAVVLSHAHTDHAGNLPNLVRSGFRGPIYCTPATRDLCNVMLFDSAYIQERDIAYVNKRNRKHGEPPAEPLYTPEDVREAMGQFVSVGYHQPRIVSDGMTARFADAGHILGSAVTLLEVNEKGSTRKLGFTGDLGRKNTPILKDPEYLESVDALISESTYGGRVHEPIAGTKELLLGVIRRTIDRGGKVVIPAFSLGRTQELLYNLFELFDEGILPVIPIYVDSPLATNATGVFRMHPECFDDETLHYLRQHEDPFGFGRVVYVRSVEESKKLNERNTPCIIIAASGMCEAGRILHHLANTVEDARNTVMIVGYQAEHTLGKRLVEKQPEVKIFGELHTLRAEVTVMNSFSAHAGQDELVEFAATLDKKQLKKVFLVHGELSQAEQLAAKLKEKDMRSVWIPERGEKAEVR
ncbi:MAG: MBL fold metallo-hydrolase [Bacteroidota bacterium]